MASLLVALLASGQLVSAQGRMLGTPIVKQPLRGDPIRLPRDERSIGGKITWYWQRMSLLAVKG